MNFIDHLSDPEIDIDYLRGLIQSATFNPNRVFTNGRHTANQETAFIAWVKSERFPELIADFKAKGVNPNICDGFGNTALHWACQNGRYKLALAIMSLPEVDIELETTYSNNSANFTRNALAIVLAQGFVRGNSTTWNFTGTPYQEVVRKMIALKPELRNIQIDGLYPVELALCHRDLEMVKLLDTPEVDHQKLEEILARDYAGTRPILYRVFTVDTVVEKAANRLSVKNWLHSKAPNWFDSDPWTQKKGAIQNYLANERAGVLQQRQPEA
ncbi:MAG: ankyrin repeat domain-containing protein [Chlamydiae bacterium]|nr:ankyrin repeat domain-containing protein [Chlamydiota bacterium]